jgi:hypothetical protein
MEYNTEREQLTLMEYGRNVQKMAFWLLNVEDRGKRNSYAATLVELMKQVNPNLKDATEYEQKVWDDLFILTNFKLEVDSPFPKPDANILDRKPERIGYLSNEIKYRHYGRNIEILIEQARKLEDPEEKEAAVVTIGKLMKSFYQTWNKEFIDEAQVLKTIKRLSDNELDIDLDKVKQNRLFDMPKTDRDFQQNNDRKGRNRNFKNKRNRGRRRNN